MTVMQNNFLRFSAAVLVAGLWAGAACAAQLTWTGAGDVSSFTDLANWSGTPTGGVINTELLVDEYIVNDNTFNVARTAPLRFVSGGGLTMSDGALTLTGGSTGIGLLQAPDTFGFLNLTGGTVTAQFLAEMNVTLGGTSELVLNGGGGPVNVSTINFTSETSSLHFIAETVAAATNEHLSKMTSFGQSAVLGVNMGIVTDGGTGSIVTATEFFFDTQLKLTVTRATGKMVLSNDMQNSVSMIEYDVFSTNGVVSEAGWTPIAGNKDLSGDKTFDSDDDWIQFTAPGSTTDLAEGTFGEATLNNGGASVSLGNGYINSPFDDLAMTIKLDDGSDLDVEIVYVGDAPDMGDFNLDGVTDLIDWASIRDNMFSDVSGLTRLDGYNSGDLTGDGLVDELDFFVFKDLYETANPGVPFSAAVPEPTSLALIGLGGLALIRRRR